MIFYSSPDEEAGALRRAVVRAGCRLEEVSIGEVPGAGQRAIGRVECGDGWGAARLVMALAAEDARTVGARVFARDLRRRARTDREFARAIVGLVKRRIRFVREPGEIFQGPSYAFAKGEGDCEDHARAVYAIAIAGRLPARLAFLHKGGGPTHAVAQLYVQGKPVWAETTVDAELGEHPVEAARRLGLRNERGDIAEGVVTMTDKDLAAIPKRFFEVNDPAQVQRDAQALARLGFLCLEGITTPGDPSDLTFRRGVLAFQQAHGIVTDGLVGPQTRRTLAGVLPLDDFGMGYVATTSAPVQSRHLSPRFFRETAELAKRFRERGANVHGEDFLAVWLGESGVLKARQGHGGLPYYGLNMMHRDHLPKVGWSGTPEAYRDLAAEEQVPYVERFYELNVRSFLRGDWSKLGSARALYMMNFTPAFIEHADDPSWVISRADDPKWGWIHRDNPAFDPEKKGFIEVADIDRWIARTIAGNRAYWSELTTRLRVEGGAEPRQGGSGALVAGLVVLVGVGAVAAHYLA